MRVDDSDDITVVHMEEGRANAIGPAWLVEMSRVLDQVEGAAPGPRGVVLTGTGRHFCAGLDLIALDAMTREQLEAFMESFDDVFLRLFLLPLPVVAAVNGHAIAGGCILALAADVRIAAAGTYRVGANEVRLGVPFPASALEIARAALRPETLRWALLEGALVEPDEALARGLVDVVVVEPPDIMDHAIPSCADLAVAPRQAFAAVKRQVRAPFAARASAQGAESRRRFADLWFSEEAKARRREALARRPPAGGQGAR